MSLILNRVDTETLLKPIFAILRSEKNPADTYIGNCSTF